MNKLEVLHNVLNRNLQTFSWDSNADGTYTLKTRVETKSPHTDVIITNDDLAQLDLRLPEVVAAMASRNINARVSHRRVALTLNSHWVRNNHVITFIPCDKRQDPPGQVWYLDEFKGMLKLKKDKENVHVKVVIYRTDETDSGISFVVERNEMHLNRPASWLDQHLHQGAQLADVVDALNIEFKEAGSYIQPFYLPVYKSNAPKCALGDIQFG